jgi:hypothetical protein
MRNLDHVVLLEFPGAPTGYIQPPVGHREALRQAELARLGAAHQAALNAEQARAKRAEDELDALRAGPLARDS